MKVILRQRFGPARSPGLPVAALKSSPVATPRAPQCPCSGRVRDRGQVCLCGGGGTGRPRTTGQPLSTGRKSIHACSVMSFEGQLLKETKGINFGQLWQVISRRPQDCHSISYLCIVSDKEESFLLMENNPAPEG